MEGGGEESGNASSESGRKKGGNAPLERGREEGGNAPSESGREKRGKLWKKERGRSEKGRRGEFRISPFFPFSAGRAGIFSVSARSAF